MSAEIPISRAFLSGDARDVAPLLLNALLIHGNRVGRIVEVEAYAGIEDAASHAFRGETPRNRSMFGPPGHLYVYFTYGMHFCANVVCSPEGTATAVLIRALAPIRGEQEMWLHRPAAKNIRDLCSGPAKLCAALSIDKSFDGVDLLNKTGDIRLVRDQVEPPKRPACGPGVGLSARVGEAATVTRRYAVQGDANVSRNIRSLA